MRKMIVHHAAKPLCLLLIVSFVLLDISFQTAKAGMITTETVIHTQTDTEARAKVNAFLAREEVQKAMLMQGVAPEEIKNRVASLSDNEVQRLAKQVDKMPAGAGLGTLVAVAAFLFILLLITDIAGLTRIFPFTRPVR